MRSRALVTGAGRRVGRATALELAGSGFDVAVHYRSSEREAERVAASCRELGADAFTLRADLASAEQCAGLVDEVRARWDRLDVLVNNASLFRPVPFAELDCATWDEMLAVNLRAPFLLSRGLLGLLEAGGAAIGAPEGQGGVVVHLCDIGAERPLKGHAHYSVSKAGLLMLVRAMAVELAPAVRTVGVSPGQVAWPPDYPPERRAKLLKRIPMGRVGAPADVARLVRHLVTEAHYVNGAVIPVDGGLGARY